jgi:hypothetical protein
MEIFAIVTGIGAASFRSSSKRHFGFDKRRVRVHCGTDPQGETTFDPWLDDPFPDYDTDQVMAFSATETSDSARVRLSHPLFSGLQPSGACV